MKAAELSKHPKFELMKQSDIVSFYHMQMPRWLFAHSKYKVLSLESKVAYTFLLNRFQLSKMNGWVNDDNEVFVIFTRESLAEEMGVSYKKAIACFKELVGARLIWEQRLGRGQPNQIYLAYVKLPNEETNKYNTTPFIRSVKSAQPTDKDTSNQSSADSIFLPNQDKQKSQDKMCENGITKAAETKHLNLPKPHTNNIKFNNKDFSNTDISQSVDERTDKCLLQIINNCELHLLPTETSAIFKNAIERLYYAKSFCVDGIELPQDKVRSDLAMLDSTMIFDAYEKLKKNDRPIKNSTAFLMAVIYNSIFEVESDLLVDPDLNRMLKLSRDDLCFGSMDMQQSMPLHFP